MNQITVATLIYIIYILLLLVEFPDCTDMELLPPFYNNKLLSCSGIAVLMKNTLCLKKNIPDVFSYNSRKH